MEVASGANFTVGKAAKLVEARYFSGVGGGGLGRSYDVSPDGQRFLMVKPGASVDATSVPREIIVVQNWTEELKRLVPRN